MTAMSLCLQRQLEGLGRVGGQVCEASGTPSLLLHSPREEQAGPRQSQALSRSEGLLPWRKGRRQSFGDKSDTVLWGIR